MKKDNKLAFVRKQGLQDGGDDALQEADLVAASKHQEKSEVAQKSFAALLP